MGLFSNRRGLVAPQNTFLDKIIRRCNTQHSNFFLANSNIYNFPIIYASEGFCKMCGYSKTEVMHQQAVCGFMHGEGTTLEMKERLKIAFELGNYEPIEILFYKKNKAELWLLVQVSPIKNDSDKTIIFLVAFKNITAFKTSTNDDDSLKDSSKFARLARTVTKNRSLLQHMSTSSTSISKVGTGFNFERHPVITDFRFDIESSGIQMNRENNSTISNTLPSYRQEAPRTPPHIILHYLNFKAIWDWIILILTGYTAVMVPYNAAFKSRNMDDIVFLVIDSIVDVVFFIDIVFNFHTTFVGPNGEVISDPNVIRINYLKGWFVVDLLSCLPYDVFNAFQPETTQSAISSLFSALKVVRLLRIGRVTRKLDQYLEYMAVSLILMIFGFVLIAHWLACIWYSVGYADLANKVDYGWIPRLTKETIYFDDWRITRTSHPNLSNVSVDDMPPKRLVYITSLYYTLSLITSIGFGNVSANTFGEKLVSVVFMLIGAFGYATIFGKVTTIFQQMNSTRARYHEMMSNVKDFIKTHCVPKDLAERVIDYISSSWAITKGIDTEKVLNYCPKDMKADLCIHLNRMVFNKHPAFRLASDGCLRALAINFQTIHTAPGDLIFHQGESIDQLCFVVSGSLEVVQDNEIVAVLGQGDVFGEPFWKEPNKLSHSTATVRALTYCDLHCIRRDCLLHILDFYTAFGNSFSRNLLLTYDLKHRLIFRKLADLRRERELEEKRKNEHDLENLDPNHPVRRMISRLRRGLHSQDHDAITSASKSPTLFSPTPIAFSGKVSLSVTDPNNNTVTGNSNGTDLNGSLMDAASSVSNSPNLTVSSKIKSATSARRLSYDILTTKWSHMMRERLVNEAISNSSENIAAANDSAEDYLKECDNVAQCSAVSKYSDMSSLSVAAAAAAAITASATGSTRQPGNSSNNTFGKSLWHRLKQPEPITEVEEAPSLAGDLSTTTAIENVTQTSNDNQTAKDSNKENSGVGKGGDKNSDTVVEVNSCNTADTGSNRKGSSGSSRAHLQVLQSNTEIIDILAAMQTNFTQELTLLQDHVMSLSRRIDILCSGGVAAAGVGVGIGNIYSGLISGSAAAVGSGHSHCSITTAAHPHQPISIDVPVISPVYANSNSSNTSDESHNLVRKRKLFPRKSIFQALFSSKSSSGPDNHRINELKHKRRLFSTLRKHRHTTSFTLSQSSSQHSHGSLQHNSNQLYHRQQQQQVQHHPYNYGGQLIDQYYSQGTEDDEYENDGEDNDDDYEEKEMGNNEDEEYHRSRNSRSNRNRRFRRDYHRSAVSPRLINSSSFRSSIPSSPIHEDDLLSSSPQQRQHQQRLLQPNSEVWQKRFLETSVESGSLDLCNTVASVPITSASALDSGGGGGEDKGGGELVVPDFLNNPNPKSSHFIRTNVATAASSTAANKTTLASDKLTSSFRKILNVPRTLTKVKTSKIVSTRDI